VWQGGDGRPWANRYVAGSGWGTAQVIKANAGRSTPPAIAFDPAGNAVAVWREEGACLATCSTTPRYAWDVWATRFE